MCCDSWGRKESDMTEWLNWLHRILHRILVFTFLALSFLELPLPSIFGSCVCSKLCPLVFKAVRSRPSDCELWLGPPHTKTINTGMQPGPCLLPVSVSSPTLHSGLLSAILQYLQVVVSKIFRLTFVICKRVSLAKPLVINICCILLNYLTVMGWVKDFHLVI